MAFDRPQVSVIMPVYNASAHLKECLDSVIGQSLRDIEIICVDDGSTDDSGKILAGYAERDARISILTQGNQGPGPARNLGMRQARGEYLSFLDSDDIFEPELLERMLELARRTGADVTVCRSDAFDSDKHSTLPSEWLLRTADLPGAAFAPQEAGTRLFQFTHGWPWDKLLRTAFIREQGLSYPPLPNSQDMAFIFPALALAERIAVIEETLIHHRMNRKGSVSNARSRAMKAPWQALCQCREILKEKGCLEQFERSLLPWAMEFLIWHMSSLPDREAQAYCYGQLRKEWFPQLPFEHCPLKCYPPRTYLKFRLIMALPYRAYWALQRLMRG